MKNKEIEELLNEIKSDVKYYSDDYDYKNSVALFNVGKIENLLSYIEQLEKENDRLKKDYSIIVNENCDNLLLEKKVEQLENNRDKAIEILERHTRYSTEELLNILKGDSDDE